MPEDIQQKIDQLNRQVVQLYQQGRYEPAIQLATQARDLVRRALGEEHPSFATSLNNLAGLYQAMSNFAAAESLYRQASEILHRALGENHPDFAVSLNNLAGLYQAMSNFAAAEPLLQQALEIWRGALGEEHQEHPDFAASLNNLAELYRAMGNFAAAEPLYRQALEIWRRTLGEKHPNFAASLNNLAELYRAMGNFAAAEPLLRQALEIRRQALGEKHQEHPDFAVSLNNLAELYLELGNFAAAEPLYRQALEIWQRALGEEHQEHPDFAASLNNLAGLYAATDRPAEALALMEQAAAIDDRMIGQVFSISSESRRMAYLETVRGSFDAFLSLVSQHLPASPTAVRAALELVLRRKTSGAEALAAQRDAILGGRYPELKPKQRELTVLRGQIAQKTLAGPGPEGPETHWRLLDEWEAQRERLEAELARQIPEMNLERRLRAADRQVVAWALPGGGALVEFVRFDVFDFQAVPARGESPWKPARYLAFVLPAGEPDNGQMIDLGEAEPIDQMIATFRASITGEAEGRSGRDPKARPARPGRAPGAPEGIGLREALFDPLSATLGGCRRLLLAPDGDLTRLPFAVLPTDDGRCLTDDYQVSYLGAGRDVLRFGAASTGEPADPLVAADPDFDLTGEAPAALPQQESGPREATSPRPRGRFRFQGPGCRQAAPPLEARPAPTPATIPGPPGRQSRDLNPDALHFGRLPATRVEGERIAGMLGIRPWLEGAVLEAHLKACRSPRILHLATHGFFLEEQRRDPHRGLHAPGAMGWPGSTELGRLAGPGRENPLLRSGLALAGVNTWLQGSSPPGEAEDGLLTAEDVSGLDLLDTELVVLSACDTGLGEVRTGEGVLGLRRAFMLAGARTLVMSLWKVSDLATALLMERFYDNLLRRGLARDESLREAQFYLREVPLGQIRERWLSAEMISQLAAGDEDARDKLQQLAQRPDDRRPFSDPYYWGAFICQGDPSPLPQARPEAKP